MRRRFPRADNSSDFLTVLGIQPWRGMPHEQQYIPAHPDGLPPIAIGVRIDPARSERIIEHEPSRFETETVVPFVRSVLLDRPEPAHRLQAET